MDTNHATVPLKVNVIYTGQWEYKIK